MRWQERAACRGMDPALFWPTPGESLTPAKEVCLSCPVRAECLDHSLDFPEIGGVWGGEGEKVRKKMRGARQRERRSSREVA